MRSAVQAIASTPSSMARAALRATPICGCASSSACRKAISCGCRTPMTRWKPSAGSGPKSPRSSRTGPTRRLRASVMEQRRYDRTAEDIGNIVGLGHVNTAVPKQRLSTLFYVTGLGLTRDPFVNTSTDNMWINVGQSQFHLPTGRIEILRGITGLVLPDRAALLERLARLREPLAGTSFDFHERNDCVETVSPWGNRIHCHAPDPERFGGV